MGFSPAALLQRTQTTCIEYPIQDHEPLRLDSMVAPEIESPPRTTWYVDRTYLVLFSQRSAWF